MGRERCPMGEKVNSLFSFLYRLRKRKDRKMRGIGANQTRVPSQPGKKKLIIFKKTLNIQRNLIKLFLFINIHHIIT